MALGLSNLTGGKRIGTQPGEVKMIQLNSIVFSPYQARKVFREEELAELAQSIREHGLLQPVLVRPFNKGYELIAGERRIRASKMVGLETVPAIVKEMDDRDVAVAGLVENLQREDLNPVEEAEGYRRLIDEFGITQETVAQRVGKSQSSIANKLRLLKLSTEIQGAISREIITERHARALLSLKDEGEQRQAFEHVTALGLNVRQTDAFVNSINARRQAEPGRSVLKRLPVVKDLRIFLNSFKHAVKAVKQAGIEATMEEADEGDRIRIVVTVSKTKTAQTRTTK